MMFKVFIAALAALFMSATASAQTFKADPKRSIYIKGEIGGSIVQQAAQMVTLAGTSKAPIDVIITSPGGGVYAGLQFISAMHLAQARGIQIRCFVPLMAASMGFQILAECDQRYAFRYALLLWHPVKSSSRDPQTSEDLLYGSRRLKAIEKGLVRVLIAKLGITRKEFFYHYVHETLWLGYELVDFAPGFIEIVDDAVNVPNPYDLRDGASED
jgi:ATP-dependent protease ClpP protease subunit